MNALKMQKMNCLLCPDALLFSILSPYFIHNILESRHHLLVSVTRSIISGRRRRLIAVL